MSSCTIFTFSPFAIRIVEKVLRKVCQPICFEFPRALRQAGGRGKAGYLANKGSPISEA
jgi:hypothetical protein